jgi:hypothetical protein
VARVELGDRGCAEQGEVGLGLGVCVAARGGWLVEVDGGWWMVDGGFWEGEDGLGKG